MILLITCTPEKSNRAGSEFDVDFSEFEDRIIKDNINAFLVMHQGELVWDYYSKGWTEDHLHIVHSCTKSIVSILIGTLFDQDLLEDVDVPVYTLFPDLNPDEISEQNKKLTLEHFLTMSTGLASRDSYLYNWEGLREIWNNENWVKDILLIPSDVPGGQRFDYSNLASFLLGELIRQKTGMDVSDYARKTLFVPLGIEKYKWDANPHGQSKGWGGLSLRPRDLLKIGQLILQQGEWEGEQLISASWIEESMKPHAQAGTLREFYGYQWWLDKDGRYLALGYEGQYLIIDPDMEIVVVFASKLLENDFFLPYKLFTDFIVPVFSKVN